MARTKHPVCACCGTQRHGPLTVKIRDRHYCADKSCAYDAARHAHLPVDKCINLILETHVHNARQAGWKITFKDQNYRFEAKDELSLNRRVTVTYSENQLDGSLWAIVEAWHKKDGNEYPLNSIRADHLKNEILGPDSSAFITLDPKTEASGQRRRTCIFHCLDKPAMALCVPARYGAAHG